MPSDKYSVERTAAGFQFVIPGTDIDKPRLTNKPKAKQYGQDGEQFVIPGAAKITAKELYERLALKPITPRRGQRSLEGTPLFKHPKKDRGVS
jgi:hypothetical protein